MTLETLYPLVSQAIRDAEAFPNPRAAAAKMAFRRVSTLEEQIAELLAPSNPEGALARRGAVRAALHADDEPRAHRLAQRYKQEAGAGTALRAELDEILGVRRMPLDPLGCMAKTGVLPAEGPNSPRKPRGQR